MYNKRFVSIYEKEIKTYRDEYYKNIILNNKKMFRSYPVITFLIPLIVSSFLLIGFDFSIFAYLLSLLSLVVLNLLIYFLFSSRVDKNDYLDNIRKYGFYSIDDYERKLRECVTGPDGYYHNLLLDLIEKYNINSSTKKIYSVKNEEFYVWCNKNKDKIYLLNSQCISKPEVKVLPLSNIRYFRVNQVLQTVILKTDNELYTFKIGALDIFNDLMKAKRLENIKKFEPGIYINDYEIYMHKVKKNLDKDYSKKREKFETSLHNSFYLLLSIILIVVITAIVPKIASVTNIINCFLIILLNLSIIGILNNIVRKDVKDDGVLIKELNNDPKNIEIFNELKYVLGINESYNRVYTKEGAEYITWLANGYFHVFLNLIYFNAVYMSVRTSDVRYFKVDGDSCDIKLKDKTLEFNVGARDVFIKMIPNKDYEWIKSYQNR